MSTFSVESRRRTDARLQAFLGENLLSVIRDPRLCELSVNPDGTAFASLAGTAGMERVGELSQYRVAGFVCSVAASLGRVIDRERDASIAGELPGNDLWKNARFQGGLPPMSPGPWFTIRMHAAKVHTLQEYVDRGILGEEHRQTIVAAIRDSKSILVAGGTFSGKTTLLNAILAEMARIDPLVRLLIIEDRVELQCSLANVVQLRVSGDLDMPALLKIVLSSRPDKIVVGEVRDVSAATFVEAQNTGHGGGMCSVHAGSVLGALRKIKAYALRGAVHLSEEQIAEAINVVVCIDKDENHPAGRVVRDVAEVMPELNERGEYQLLRR